MKLTYLGTSAAEGFPALFCKCEYCNKARELGGKNIRTRSQSLINDDMLIDFPADTYHHFLQNEIRGDEIKYLLITHPHHDHFYPTDLFNRYGCYAHNMSVPVLKMFCSEHTYSFFKGALPQNVDVTVLEPFKKVDIGDYRVTPLPAKHMPDGQAFIYIIEGEKTLLYAHDTGYFYESVFEYIASQKLTFDMISLDCTNVDIPISDEGGHLGLPNIQRVCSRLSDIGAITESTVKYINHFSHNAAPLHDDLTHKASNIGFKVSYDSCAVEF